MPDNRDKFPNRYKTVWKLRTDCQKNQESTSPARATYFYCIVCVFFFLLLFSCGNSLSVPLGHLELPQGKENVNVHLEHIEPINQKITIDFILHL